MRKFLSTLAISLCIGLGLTSKAEAKFSCDELMDVEHSLSDLSVELKRVGSIKVGSKMDKDLDGLINHVFDMAKVEKNAKLTSAAKSMDSAWHDANWKAFRAALDRTATAVANLHNRDC
jgi:hypothetical protein